MYLGGERSGERKHFFCIATAQERQPQLRYTGMRPCFFLGRSSFLCRRTSKDCINRLRVSVGRIAAWANCFERASNGPLNRSWYSAIFSARVLDGSADCSISRLYKTLTAPPPPITANSTPGHTSN